VSESTLDSGRGLGVERNVARNCDDKLRLWNPPSQLVSRPKIAKRSHRPEHKRETDQQPDDADIQKER